MSESASAVATRRVGDAAVLQLNRPEARNALNAEAWRALVEALEDVSTQMDATRAVIIAGSPRFFCAGGDVKSMPSGGGRLDQPVVGLTAAQKAIRAIARSPLPVICAVDGYAIGAGWGLALACDIVVAGRSAFFQAPFAARGLVADGGVAWFLARRLGHHRALELLLGGEKISAERAHAFGLVNELVPDGSALDAALGRASALSEGPAESNALTKMLVRRVGDLDFDSFLQLEWASAALAHQGADAREGRRAFVERRRPGFRS